MRSTVLALLLAACELDGSFGNDDSADTDACALATGEPDCAECHKRRCCESVVACLDEPACACSEDCVAMGNDPTSCAEQCDAASDAAWLDLDACAASECPERCP